MKNDLIIDLTVINQKTRKEAIRKSNEFRAIVVVCNETPCKRTGSGLFDMATVCTLSHR
ncbi:MAG: hypothetical protein GXO81_11500 [Chlorobi bacterium]|nr:hypothetical protein [Chlorobiota bacterium]